MRSEKGIKAAAAKTEAMHLPVRGGLRDYHQDRRPHGRPLRDEAAEDGCRSAGDSGAVLSDAQGGVFCRSGRDEGEGARPFA